MFNTINVLQEDEVHYSTISITLRIMGKLQKHQKQSLFFNQKLKNVQTAGTGILQGEDIF